MATITRHEIERDNNSIEHAPMVRIGLNGEGCGAGTCHCSDEPFIAISDGKTWLSVRLSPEEAALIKAGHSRDMELLVVEVDSKN